MRVSGDERTREPATRCEYPLIDMPRIRIRIRIRIPALHCTATPCTACLPKQKKKK